MGHCQDNIGTIKLVNRSWIALSQAITSSLLSTVSQILTTVSGSLSLLEEFRLN